MLIHPAFSAILKPSLPRVTLTDVREDVSDLTTYTFTSCNLGDFGGTGGNTADAYGTNPTPRVASRKFVYVIVHGEDAATTFGVNSVTINGLGGSETVDRGGATNAINTALYVFSTEILSGITNTDIAVTFSEAVTGCAIGVILVENITGAQNVGSASASNTGIMTAAAGNGLTGAQNNLLVLSASTCITGGATELPEFDAVQTSGNYWPVLLYHGSNAEFDYAAAWSYGAGYFSGLTEYGNRVQWSGIGAADLINVVIG